VSETSRPSPQPLSWGRHRDWSWRKPTDYDFAREWRSVPITLREVADAASCFPIVFTAGASGLAAHALLRVGKTGASAFIGREGRWQAAWLPPRVAAYPFDLVEVPNGHALALDETSDLAIHGPGELRIFEMGGAANLTSETAQIVALLKSHAEELPATLIATTALRDNGLLAPLDGERQLLTVRPIAAADLNDDQVIALNKAGALMLLHAGCVSLAHLPWMAKAEKHLAAVAATKSHPPPARNRGGIESSFLAALAADPSADAAMLHLPGPSQS